MSKTSIYNYLESDLREVLSRMDASLHSDVSLLNSINKTILGGGKLLRPALALLVGRCLSADGGLSGDTLAFAAAVELLHNATLLHDDVVDGSGMRRGQPTLYSRVGGTAAVLVGDYWLVKAMDNILSTSYSSRLSKVAAKTLSDLAVGEMLQMEKAAGADTQEDDYKKIIYCKTASLFETSVLGAAICQSVPARVEGAVATYGRNLGMAFQIKDDILDYEGGHALGKPVGQDIRECKITLPLLGAIRGAPEEEGRGMRSLLAAGVPSEKDITRILGFVARYDGIGYARERMNDFLLEARSALGELPAGRDRDYLMEMLSIVSDRNN